VSRASPGSMCVTSGVTLRSILLSLTRTISRVMPLLGLGTWFAPHLSMNMHRTTPEGRRGASSAPLPAEEVLRRALLQALSDNNGSIRRAAQALGMSTDALRQCLRMYGIREAL